MILPQNGDTALTWASFNVHEGCLKALLAAGANKDYQKPVSPSDASYMAPC